MVDVVLAVGLVFAMFVTVIVGVAILGAVRLAGRTRRRAVAVVSTARLRASALSGGSNRDIAGLRLRLRASVQHCRTVLTSPVVLAGASPPAWWNDAADQLVAAGSGSTRGWH